MPANQTAEVVPGLGWPGAVGSSDLGLLGWPRATARRQAEARAETRPKRVQEASAEFTVSRETKNSAGGALVSRETPSTAERQPAQTSKDPGQELLRNEE